MMQSIFLSRFSHLQTPKRKPYLGTRQYVSCLLFAQRNFRAFWWKRRHVEQSLRDISSVYRRLVWLHDRVKFRWFEATFERQ